MRSFRKWSKHYRLILVTYIILFAITVSLSTLGYFYAYATIRDGLETNFAALLREQQLSYDKEWRRAQVSASYIGSNTKARELAALTEWETSDRLDAPDVISEIASLQYGNDSFQSMGIFMYRSQSVLTDSTRYEGKLADYYLQEYGLDSGQLSEKTGNGEGYFFSSVNGKEYIFFYYNVFNRTYKDRLATAYCILSWDRITNRIDGSLTGSGDTGVFLQRNNQDTIGAANLLFPPEALQHIPSGSSSELKADGTVYIVSSLKSSHLDACYYLYAPKGLYFARIQRFLYLIIAELVISIFVGLFLAHRFSKKSALPVERLQDLLKGQQDSLQDDSSLNKIYANLEHSLQALVDSSEKLQRKLSSREETLGSFALVSLLKGSYQDDWLTGYSEKLRQQIPFADYSVILFSFQGNADSFLLPSGDDRQLFLFAAKNVICEAILGSTHNAPDGKSAHGILLTMSDTLACIVDMDYIERQNETLPALVQECISFFDKMLRVQTFAALSDTHHKPEELHTAYEEAMLALTHNAFWDNSLGNLFTYENVETADWSKKSTALIERVQILTRQLTNNQYETAHQTLDEILNHCFYPDVQFMTLNRYQGAALICLLVNKLLENQVPPEDVLPYIEPGSDDWLISSKSIREIGYQLHSILDNLSDAYQRSQGNAEWPDWFPKAEAYIADHYCDPMLNVSSLADCLNVTPAYIGKCFKKYKGVAVLDYIHGMRIAKSKELLAEGISVSECAGLTGYLDSKSFIRTFRKYEGITPGQFKTQAVNRKTCDPEHDREEYGHDSKCGSDTDHKSDKQ